MKTSKELQHSFQLFQESYDSFFEAIHSVAKNKKFSALEFAGVIHRASALTIFAVECINRYLIDKGIIKQTEEEVTAEEEVVKIAHKHKIITNKENWLLAIEMMQIYFFSHDKQILAEIIAFINEIFQDLIVDLYNYFADEFKGKL
jgi:hypothetical protein